MPQFIAIVGVLAVVSILAAIWLLKPQAQAAAAVVEKRRKVTHVGAPACFLLELGCQQINAAFGGFGCYLVGSAVERPDWRDIDVRLIMPDDEFKALFPGVTIEANDWESDPRWLLMTITISERLSKLTGLPVDFQFQAHSRSTARYGSKPRYPLGK